MKKRLFWIVPASLVLIALVAYPWYKLQAKADDLIKQQELLTTSQSFVNTYGSNVKILSVVEPERIRIFAVSWSDDKYSHVSLYVNGVWFEVSRRDLSQVVTPTPTPNK